MNKSAKQRDPLEKAANLKRLFFTAEGIVLLLFILSLALFFSFRRSFRHFRDSDFFHQQQRIALLTNAHRELLDEEGDTLSTGRSSASVKRMSLPLLDDWNGYRKLAATSQTEMPANRKEAERQNIGRIDSLIQIASAVHEERNAMQGFPSALISRIKDKNDELLFLEMERLQQMHDEESSALERWTFLWIVLAGLACGSALLLAVLYKKQKEKVDEGPNSYFITLESTLNPVQIVRFDGTTRYANPAFYKWSGFSPDNAENGSFLQTIHAGGSEQNASIWKTAIPALQQSKLWSGEILHTRPDGQTAAADILVVPFVRRDENMLDYIVFYTDASKKNEFAQKLQDTQKLYQGILEGSLDGLIVVQNDTVVYANPKAVNIFGYESAYDVQLVPFSVLFQLNAGETSSAEQIVSESVLLEKAEFRCRTKNARIIDVESHTLSIGWEGKPSVLVSFRDVTERKMIERERALCAWEQEKLSEIDKQLIGVANRGKIFDAIVHQTIKLTRSEFAGIIEYDMESEEYRWKASNNGMHEHFRDWKKAPQTFGILKERTEMVVLKKEEKEGESLFNDIPELYAETIASALFLPLRAGKILQGFLIVGYASQHDSSGREIRLLHSLAKKSSIAIANAKLYDDLIEHEKELELLSAARVQVLEEERRRTAREIHDGLGQLLTAIKFNLEILEDTLSTTTDEQNRINDMKKLLDDVMKEARDLSYSLMPSVLEDFGLIPAVQLLCEQFSQQTGIHVQFLPFGYEGRFSPELELGVYRIAQEALTNIQKHAAAADVELQIIASENSVRMTVEDNGKGFMEQKSIRRQKGRKGIGLMRMRERASLLGGTFAIESALQRGTLVCVEIPIKKEESKP